MNDGLTHNKELQMDQNQDNKPTEEQCECCDCCDGCDIPPDDVRYEELHNSLLLELEISRNSIMAEVAKPPEERDPYYLMGAERLNVAIENLLIALQESGLVEVD